MVDINKPEWGYSGMFDCSGCNPESIRDSNNISRFVKDLVKKIDMVAYGEPQIVHFGSGNKAGYTLVQLIETSNICAHFVEETNDIYLDVFSCKGYKEEDVMEILNQYFNPSSIKRMKLARRA